jgi:mono/diheme cytochrome c family protein
VVRALAALLLLGACNAEDPWMRMYDQKKAKAYAHTDVFADGRVNRVPPAGTVPRERPLELEQQMPKLTLELLRAGQKRYIVICATCHGITGESDSIVATNFSERQPPSFHEQRLREKSDRHIFTVIGSGYGMMPSFPEIPIEERWAVVGYIRALQRSQRAPLDDAPPDERAKLMQQLATRAAEPDERAGEPGAPR